MSDRWPVTVAVSRADGSVEHVRVGTAVKQGDGFSLTLEPMTIKPEGADRGTGFAVPRAVAPPPPGGGGGMLLPNYGRSKGMPIVGASLSDLEFYANGSRRSLADPSKSRFHEKEKGMLAALEAEIARQRGGGSSDGPPSDDVPPPGDDDAPF